MKKEFFIRRFFVLLAFIMYGGFTFGQGVTVTGTITDVTSKDPLPGVTVLIKGTSTGTATSMDGKYLIQAKANDVLVFSFVGYEAQEIPVNGRSVIDIALKVSSESLDEVVVIGYGTVKKTDLTGSVTTVSSKDFNKGSITSPQELIVGKSAGVVVTSTGGAPGSNSTVRIRGGSSLKANNDPLYVIDGFPIDNTTISGLANPLMTINPSDIESVTVLKDASAAAIYGSRASNGVIIITTKKGSLGVPFKVSYNSNVSVGVPVKLIDVMDAKEFRAALQAQIDAGKITGAAINYLGTANTDWQKEIYRNAISTDQNVSVMGAVKKVPYRASYGYTSQNGLLDNSNIKRSTLDIGVSPSFLDDHLSVNVNVKGMNIDNDFSNTDAIGSAVEFDPTQPIRNGNTRFGGYTAWTNSPLTDINALPNNIATHNPVTRLKYRDNTSNVKRAIANAQLGYKFHFLPELRANLNLGYDYTDSKGHDNTDTLASWSYREPEKNYKTYSQNLKTSLLDFFFNYQKDLSSISSKIDATAGYSWQHFYREKNDFNRPWKETNGVYIGANDVVTKNENFLVSFFGRLNYTLLDRYLLTLTVRDDGSSRFSKDNRWGLFPSAAFAWKIKNESFLSGVSYLSDLKLRLGYGVTGQQDISDNYWPYLPTYAISQQGAYYQFGNEFYPTQRPNRYDANIKWEETTTSNIGFDFGLFNDRVVGSFDYYKRVTDNLINEIPIAAGTNFSNFLITNVGSLENTGYEATLGIRIISTKELSWEVNGTFSRNLNKITKLTRVNDPNYVGYDVGDISGGVGNKVQINSVGHPANSFLLFKQVYDSNGNPIEGLYVDKTGTGGNVAGNNANKYYLGKPAADYIIGLSSRLNYKNFDLSFSGRLSIGNYVYNNNNSNRALYQQMYNQSGYTSNILSAVSETKFFTAQYWSDTYLEDASFFRMDNISLGYQFNKLLTEKLKGRLNFTVQNAFVITKYSGLDPEVDGGIDNNIYPRPRTFILGIQIDF
ncbi:MAG: SusC/RagA family TonB-linked outer membrane protein [Bacteroidales bacterium]|nr:SusC/RagA family TonB-linked outer membrane protein [Bacteroidales bacterium]